MNHDSLKSLCIKLIQLIALIAIVPLIGEVKASSIDRKISKIRKGLPKHCRFRITSGHRTKEHNRRIGGAKFSYHLMDRARDIVTNCSKIVVDLAEEHGLSSIKYKGHIHLDDRSEYICLISKGNKRAFAPC